MNSCISPTSTWGCPAFDANAHCRLLFPEDYHNGYTIGYKYGVTDWRIQLNVNRDCTDFHIKGKACENFDMGYHDGFYSGCHLVGKNSTQSCYGTNDKYNQTRYWVGYHDGLRDGKKGVGGEYDNINCGIGWNMQCTPYESGYYDGFFITCDESTCFEYGSPPAVAIRWPWQRIQGSPSSVILFQRVELIYCRRIRLMHDT